MKYMYHVLKEMLHACFQIPRNYIRSFLCTKTQLHVYVYIYMRGWGKKEEDFETDVFFFEWRFRNRCAARTVHEVGP